jgi:hypothetical protein
MDLLRHLLVVVNHGVEQDSKKIVKCEPKEERCLKKTFKTMEGFCFVISVAGLSGPNTGKDDDGSFLWCPVSVLPVEL